MNPFCLKKKEYPKHKVLDDVLKFISKTSEDKPIDLESDLASEFKQISGRDRRCIMEKLYKDKMVDSFIPNISPNSPFNEGKKYQYITFEGLLHLEKEGYTMREIRNDITIRRKEIQVFILLAGSVASIMYILFRLIVFFIECDTNAFYLYLSSSL